MFELCKSQPMTTPPPMKGHEIVRITLTRKVKATGVANKSRHSFFRKPYANRLPRTGVPPRSLLRSHRLNALRGVGPEQLRLRLVPASVATTVVTSRSIQLRSRTHIKSVVAWVAMFYRWRFHAIARGAVAIGSTIKAENAAIIG